jgi:hypothetical protein
MAAYLTQGKFECLLCLAAASQYWDGTLVVGSDVGLAD